MKRHLLIFFLPMFFSGLAAFTQNPAVFKGRAEAFSKTNIHQMQAVDSLYSAMPAERIKKPNPIIYKSLTTVDLSQVTDLELIETLPQYRLQAVSPLPDTTFNGLDDTGNSIPPDVNGAPGPDHIVVTLNTQVCVQDRVGTPLKTLSLGAFWSSLPGSGTFDPKIQYDFHENRWVFVTCAGSEPGSSRIYLGISADSDPLGDWYLYSYIADPENKVWFDYPSMGFNNRWIVVSGNMFGNGSYRTVYIFDKQAMLNGEPEPFFTRIATTQGFTIVPAITYDEDEQDIYCVASANGNQGGNGYITLFKVHGELLNPQFSVVGQIGTNQTWAGYVNGSGDFLPQLGTTELINAVDHRMENVVFRNGKIWAAHHVFLPANNPTRTAVQWWNITTDGTILQRGRVDDPTGQMSYAFTTIAVNLFEDVMIGHGIFSAQQYAAGGYSFRSAGDPPNTLRQPYQFKDGLAPYYKTFGSGRNRWGDYTATMTDPVNSIDFWTIQQYADLPSGGDRWGTWWAYVRIQFAPQADFVANQTLIPLGESVDFTDLTAGVPQNWQWNFEGAVPSSSNLQNPVGIQYPNAGTFNVSLSVTNDFGTDTKVRAGYITVSPTLLPVVDFVANKNLVCTGETVKFTDKTQYMPISWEWIFNPPSVTFVNGTDQFSQNPEVIFNESETYSVTLIAANLNGSSEKTIFNLVRAGGMNVPLVERFNQNGFLANQWKVVNPDNKKTWEITQVNGLTETDMAARLDFSTYYSIGERDRLVSPPLDLRGYNNMKLGFKHAHAKRIPPISDSLIVLVSDNCGQSWTRIFADAENGSGNFATHVQADPFVPLVREDWCGVGWGAPCFQLSLDNWAGKDNVLIAFETYSGYGNPMYITDIEISTTVQLSEIAAHQPLKVVPNPVKSSLIIQSENIERFEVLQLWNAAGKLLREMKNVANGSQIEVGNLPAGIYSIRASTNHNVLKAFFVKE